MLGQAEAKLQQGIHLLNRAGSGCVTCVPTKGLKSRHTVIQCYFNYHVSIYIVSHHTKGQILSQVPSQENTPCVKKQTALENAQTNGRAQPPNTKYVPICPGHRSAAEAGPNCPGAMAGGDTALQGTVTRCQGGLVRSYASAQHCNLSASLVYDSEVTDTKGRELQSQKCSEMGKKPNELNLPKLHFHTIETH